MDSKTMGMLMPSFYKLNKSGAVPMGSRTFGGSLDDYATSSSSNCRWLHGYRIIPKYRILT
jgi:hypothetical protein